MKFLYIWYNIILLYLPTFFLPITTNNNTNNYIIKDDNNIIMLYYIKLKCMDRKTSHVNKNNNIVIVLKVDPL